MVIETNEVKNSPPAAGPDPEQRQATVFLKARIMKDQVGFHKLVYSETASQVGTLIESLLNRGKENQFTKRQPATTAIVNKAAAGSEAEVPKVIKIGEKDVDMEIE